MSGVESVQRCLFRKFEEVGPLPEVTPYYGILFSCFLNWRDVRRCDLIEVYKAIKCLSSLPSEYQVNRNLSLNKEKQNFLEKQNFKFWFIE